MIPASLSGVIITPLWDRGFVPGEGTDPSRAMIKPFGGESLAQLEVAVQSMTPLGRNGRAEDIAELVTFLASNGELASKAGASGTMNGTYDAADYVYRVFVLHRRGIRERRWIDRAVDFSMEPFWRIEFAMMPWDLVVILRLVVVLNWLCEIIRDQHVRKQRVKKKPSFQGSYLHLESPARPPNGTFLVKSTIQNINPTKSISSSTKVYESRYPHVQFYIQSTILQPCASVPHLLLFPNLSLFG